MSPRLDISHASQGLTSCLLSQALYWLSHLFCSVCQRLYRTTLQARNPVAFTQQWTELSSKSIPISASSAKIWLCACHSDLWPKVGAPPHCSGCGSAWQVSPSGGEADLDDSGSSCRHLWKMFLHDPSSRWQFSTTVAPWGLMESQVGTHSPTVGIFLDMPSSSAPVPLLFT